MVETFTPWNPQILQCCISRFFFSSKSQLLIIYQHTTACYPLPTKKLLRSVLHTETHTNTHTHTHELGRQYQCVQMKVGMALGHKQVGVTAPLCIILKPLFPWESQMHSHFAWSMVNWRVRNSDALPRTKELSESIVSSNYMCSSNMEEEKETAEDWTPLYNCDPKCAISISA